MEGSSRPSLNALTGVRFLAALHVVLIHLLLIQHQAKLPSVIREIVTRGYMAVPLFFVLSGFVLTYTYGRPSPQAVSGRGFSARDFWGARFARIYPVYALALLVSIPFFVPPRTLAAWVLAPVLLQGWDPQVSEAWNPPAWSLSAEAFFYLLFPLFAPVAARLNVRKLTLALPVVWLASLAAPIAFELAAPGTLARSGEIAQLVLKFIYSGPPSHVPEFIMGVVLGRLFLSRRQDGTEQASSSKRAALGAAAGLIGYVIAAYVGGSLARPLTHTGAFLPIYGLLVYCLALGGGPLGRLLATRPLVLLGEASYGLYLLHMPVIWWTEAAVLMLPNGQAIIDRRWFPALEVLLGVGVSVAVFLVFERPARRLLRRVLTTQDRTYVPAGSVASASAAALTP